MKTTHLLLIVGAMCTTTFSACKKYENGPRLSLHTKKARIVNVWKYDHVTANGTDVTASYVNRSVEFKKDDNYILTDGLYANAGTWQFASDKEDIVLSATNSSSAITWHILKLKNRELWVAEHNGSSSYEYHFLPK